MKCRLLLSVALAFGALTATPTVSDAAPPAPEATTTYDTAASGSPGQDAVQVATEETPSAPTVAGAVPVEAEATTVEIGPPSDAVSGMTQTESVVSAVASDLAVVGVTWDETQVGPEIEVRLRSHDDEGWSVWQTLEITPAVSVGEHGADARGGTEPVVVLDAEQVEVMLITSQGELPTDPQLTVIDPGESDADRAVPVTDAIAGGTPVGGRAPTTLATGAPTIRTRADWGADESIRFWAPAQGQVTGVVVHHTAGQNGYSAEAVPGIIRGIYRYHAVTRGWGDIGYNIIVDRFGRAWEGRYGGARSATIGAHAAGVNATMFGISVLGNYDQVPVPDLAFRTVAQVIAWKFALHGISTAGHAKGLGGKPVPRIIGHKDVAQTACPGRYFYPRMGELTRLVANFQGTMPEPSAPVVRIAGQDRFGTSAAASRYSNSWADTVFVATGRDYADALAAGPAATRADGPVLLVNPNGVPAEIHTELKRLRPKTIYVLGGEGAISSSTVDTLRQYATVKRIAGSNRYETAAGVGRTMWPTARTVYLTSGQDFADALSGGAAAAYTGAPMYLATQNVLPHASRAEIARINPARVIVVGGEQVISSAVLGEVRRAAPNANVIRLAGENRFDTSAVVAEQVWPSGSSATYYATGWQSADALSAVASAGDDKSPLVLSRGSCTDRTVIDAVRAMEPQKRVVVGGSAVIESDAPDRRC